MLCKMIYIKNKADAGHDFNLCHICFLLSKYSCIQAAWIVYSVL